MLMGLEIKEASKIPSKRSVFFIHNLSFEIIHIDIICI